MNILLTGGAGFIGSHLTDRLVEAGNYVYVLDNLSSGSLENLSAINKASWKWIDGDVRRKLSEQIPTIDVIVHLAAIGSVPRSMKDPSAYMQTNVLGFHNVLEFARQRHIKTVFYASSSSVYGNMQKFYRYESDMAEPCSPYAMTKFMNEVMAQTYERAFWIDCYGLRFFNVFGPRQKLGSEYAAVIPKFCQGILNEGRIKIYGDGNQIRTFTPVDFVCEAVSMMVQNPHSLKARVFNVTHHNYAMSVNDTARLIGRILNKGYHVEFMPERQGDIKSSIGHGLQLERETSIDPNDFPIIEAMRDTCKFYESKLIAK